MSAIAAGLLLLALGNVAAVILTSPDRLGSEGPLVGVLCALAMVLAVGITERTWYAHAPHKRAERD